MTGILAALRQDNFTCYGPASVDDIDLSSVPDDRDTRPPRGKFLEIPRPSGRFLPVPAIADNDPLLFRFFVDGSQRITNAGYIVDTKNRYLPLLQTSLHRPRWPDRVGQPKFLRFIEF